MKIITRKELEYYGTETGEMPFISWLESLRDINIRSRVKERLDRVRLGNLGDHKRVGGGVSELRLQFGSGYRIYYGEEGDKVILLLCGGDKSSQKNDIKNAIAYWNDYLERWVMSKVKSKSYQEYLIESLKDPVEAVSYLNAALEGGDIKVFLLALHNVIEARGGVAKIASKAEKSRTSLYKTLSEAGNPYLKNTNEILAAMGMHLSVMQNQKASQRHA